jgi:hypothetical protein
MSTETPDPELTALAASLAALKPAAGRLDRDQLLFRAGQASMRRGHWLWPGATAVLAVLAVTLGLFAFWPRPPQRIEYVLVQPPEPVPAPASAGGDRTSLSEEDTPPAAQANTRQQSPLSYYELEQLVSRWGIEAMPRSIGAGGGSRGKPEPMLAARITDQFVETQIP